MFICEHGRGKIGILHSLWCDDMYLNLFNQPIACLIQENIFLIIYFYSSKYKICRKTQESISTDPRSNANLFFKFISLLFVCSMGTLCGSMWGTGRTFQVGNACMLSGKGSSVHGTRKYRCREIES